MELSEWLEGLLAHFENGQEGINKGIHLKK
jgi:hypothetical protein